MRTGVAELPLHPGKAPAWLFGRMARLGAAVVETLLDVEGHDALLGRLADPYWFQALGCLLGFDWHSSGVTTTVTGALQTGLADRSAEVGLWICGGKGGRSRRTPSQIEAVCERTGLDAAPLVRASRLAARVDSAAVQDGYQLYHHAFVVTREGRWAVVQQGMSDLTGMARRYHWLGEGLSRFDLAPHAAIACDGPRAPCLDLTAVASEEARQAVTTLATMEPRHFEAEVAPLRRLSLPARHEVVLEDLASSRFRSVRLATYEGQPGTFEELLGTPGLGARSLRALALLAEVLFGAAASVEDPARFSFAHGGKDGHPFPVDRSTYDGTIALLEGAVRRARLGDREQVEALRRLERFTARRGAPEPGRPPGARDGLRAGSGLGGRAAGRLPAGPRQLVLPLGPAERV